MFNRHLSLSHPPPVHRSEETGLHNPLHPVQNKSAASSASTGAALSATWPDLVQLIKLTSLICFIAIIIAGKFYKHTNTHTTIDRLIVYSDLLLRTIIVIFVDLEGL